VGELQRLKIEGGGTHCPAFTLTGNTNCSRTPLLGSYRYGPQSPQRRQWTSDLGNQIPICLKIPVEFAENRRKTKKIVTPACNTHSITTSQFTVTLCRKGYQKLLNFVRFCSTLHYLQMTIESNSDMDIVNVYLQEHDWSTFRVSLSTFL